MLKEVTEDGNAKMCPTYSKFMLRFAKNILRWLHYILIYAGSLSVPNESVSKRVGSPG
jgi:hypothetical protein